MAIREAFPPDRQTTFKMPAMLSSIMALLGELLREFLWIPACSAASCFSGSDGSVHRLTLHADSRGDGGNSNTLTKKFTCPSELLTSNVGFRPRIRPVVVCQGMSDSGFLRFLDDFRL